MANLAIDYSWHHPDPAAIAGAGYKGVLRYLSPDTTKNLSVGEASALHSVGLAIGLVWESTAQASLSGAGQGAADAKAANVQADALGFPRSLPIYFASDFQVQPAQIGTVMAYYSAAQAASVRPIGTYGSLYLCESLSNARIGVAYWQTEAWSGSAVSPVANIYQRVSPTLPAIPGGGYDENVLISGNWGGWLETPSPTPNPTPVPVPTPTPAPTPTPPPAPIHAPDGNPWTILVTDGNFGPYTVRAVQWKCGVAQDGMFGPMSKRAFQAHLHVTVDGIIGPNTIRALQAHVGATQDGVWGSQTTAHLQMALNRATF